MTQERQAPEPEFRFPRFSPMRPRGYLTKLPKGKETKKYVSEPKWNGIRALVEISQTEITIKSMTERKITAHFPELVEAFEKLKGEGNIVLDGEIIFGTGTTVEHQRKAIARSQSKPPQILPPQRQFSFMVFDLPFYKEDLRKMPLTLRKRLLTKLLGIRFEEQGVFLTAVQPNPQKMLEVAQELGLEGMVLKRKDSPYVSGYSTFWLKLKRAPTPNL